MIFDKSILDDIAAAAQIKSTVPESTVSVDAIFLALRGIPQNRKRTRKNTTTSYGVPPERFHEALVMLKGRALTIGEFTVLAGMSPASKTERNAIGAWLRITGRKPRKSGSRQVFDI